MIAYIAVATVLFSIGFFGVLTRKNIIAVLMSIELMFVAVTINLVAFNNFVWTSDMAGQIFSLFIIVLVAVELIVGLAILYLVVQNRNYVSYKNLDIHILDNLVNQKNLANQLFGTGQMQTFLIYGMMLLVVSILLKFEISHIDITFPIMTVMFIVAIGLILLSKRFTKKDTNSQTTNENE